MKDNKSAAKKSLIRSQGFKIWAAIGVVVVLAIIGYFVIGIHAAGSATLRVQPTTGTLTPGGTVSVGIYVDAGATPVSLVHADLTFPASQLTCQDTNVVVGTTFPRAIVASCSNGSLSVVTGRTGAGISGDGLLVATVTFTVGSTPGSVPLTFNQSTSSIIQTSDGANIAGTFTGGNYNIPYPAPTISGVSPASGSTLGGTPVTITGANFRSGATVSFGGAAATGVTVASGTSITATTPAHAAGAVSVVVTNTDGRTGSGSFTYVTPPPPTITSISPNHGPLAGGTTITITGSNYTATPTVTVGGTAATSVHLVSGTSLTAVTPAHATSGSVAVVVTNPGGLSATSSSGYSYDALPCTANPSVPGSLHITATTLNSVSLAWNASNPGAGCTLGAYKLRRTEGGQLWNVSGTSYVDGGLTSGATYHYTVEATDTSGHVSGQSAAVPATTLVDNQKPTDPSNVIGSARDSAHIDLSWTASTDAGGSGLAGYNIYRNGSPFKSLGTSTTWTDTEVSDDTDYSYAVEARDGAGNVSPHRVPSVPATIHTPKAIEKQPPTVPQNLHTTIVTSNSVALAWDASTDTGGSGLAGYHVYRNGQLLSPDPTSPSFVDKGLNANSAYVYAVVAYDHAANASQASSNLNVRTLAASGGGGSHVTITPTGSGTNVGVDDGQNLNVSDNVTVAPDDSGDLGPIQKVEYYLDGKLVATVTSEPFSYQVDTTKLLNGKHKLMTKTYYVNGQIQSATNPLVVKNPMSFKLFVLYAKAYAAVPLLIIILLGLAAFSYLRRDMLMALVKKANGGATAAATPKAEGVKPNAVVYPSTKDTGDDTGDQAS